MWLWRGMQDQVSKWIPQKTVRGSSRPRSSTNLASRTQSSRNGPQGDNREDTTNSAVDFLRLGESVRTAPQYRQRHRRPRKRYDCQCCIKRFSRLEQFLGMGQKKCPLCKKIVCKSCIPQYRCHKCYVIGRAHPEPNNLLNTEVRELITFLKILHQEDPSFSVWPKSYLVKKLLEVLELHEPWDPTSHLTREEELALVTTLTTSEDTQVNDSGHPEEDWTSCGRYLEAHEDEGDHSGHCCAKCRSALIYDEGVQGEGPEIPAEDLCKICMDGRADVIFLDCGHLVCCLACSELIRQCPICRMSISSKIRISKLF